MIISIDITTSRFVFPYTLEGSGQKGRQDWWDFFYKNGETGKLKNLPHERKKRTWKTSIFRFVSSPGFSLWSLPLHCECQNPSSRIVFKNNWIHHKLVHNMESTSLFRLAIANYKADPETPTCTTDVDPTWTKVFHPEQNHCDFAPQSVVKPWLIPWCPTARSTSSLSSLSSSGFLWRCLSCFMLSLRGDHGFEEKKSLRA